MTRSRSLKVKLRAPHLSRVSSIQFSSVQFSSKWYLCARKSSLLRAPPIPLRSFPNDTFEILPAFIWETMNLSRSLKVKLRAPHLSRVSSVQFRGSVRSEKLIITRSTPSLSSLPNVAGRNSSYVRLADDNPFSFFKGKASSASSF